LAELTHKTADVFGVSRDLPITYIERDDVDDKLLDNLTRDKHVIIYGSSKQGKTCLRRHCLQEDDYILIQCQNTWDVGKLSEAILKAVLSENSIRPGIRVVRQNHRMLEANARSPTFARNVHRRLVQVAAPA